MTFPDASRVARTSRTAGELAQDAAYVKSLFQQARHLESRIAAAQEEERACREALTAARVELRKLEILDEQLTRAQTAADEQALRRAVDDRVGAISATRSRDG